MLKVKYVLAFLIISIINSCNILQSTDPSNYQTKKEEIYSLNQLKCINELLSSLKYNSNEFKLNSYLTLLHDNFKLDIPLYKTIMNSRLDKIEKLRTKYLPKKGIEELINPAVKWKENKQYISIQISYKKRESDKFICDSLENESLEIINDSNNVHFDGLCRKDGKLIKFELNLVLKGKLNKSRSFTSNLSKNTKGTYTATLYKTEFGLWNDLLSREYYKDKDLPCEVLKWGEYRFKEVKNVQGGNNNINRI